MVVEQGELETVALTADSGTLDASDERMIRFEFDPFAVDPDSPVMSVPKPEIRTFHAARVDLTQCVNLARAFFPTVFSTRPLELLEQTGWIDGPCIQVLGPQPHVLSHLAGWPCDAPFILTPSVQESLGARTGWAEYIIRLPSLHESAEHIADFDDYSSNLESERSAKATTQPGTLADPEWDD